MSLGLPFREDPNLELSGQRRHVTPRMEQPCLRLMLGISTLPILLSPCSSNAFQRFILSLANQDAKTTREELSLRGVNRKQNSDLPNAAIHPMNLPPN
jgi:hypothetical protein